MKVKLHDVTFAFVQVLEAKGFQGSTDNPTYSASLIFDEKSPAHRALHDAVKEVCQGIKGWENPGLKAKFRGNIPPKRGDENTNKEGVVYDGFAGRLWVRANRQEKNGPPRLKGPRGEDLTRENASALIYSGAVGLAVVDVWAQTGKHGRYGINCELLGLQHKEHGERIGGGGATVSDDDFEVYDTTEDDVFGDEDDFEPGPSQRQVVSVEHELDDDIPF